MDMCTERERWAYNYGTSEFEDSHAIRLLHIKSQTGKFVWLCVEVQSTFLKTDSRAK